MHGGTRAPLSSKLSHAATRSPSAATGTTCACSAGCSARPCGGRRATSGTQRVERFRAFAKRTRRSGMDETRAERFAALANGLSDQPIAAAVPIARAFAQFLALANIAEQHHRVRRRREYAREPGRRAAARFVSPTPSRAGATTACRPSALPTP